MTAIRVESVTENRVENLCQMCVPREKRSEPDWVKGTEEKRRWALEKLKEWGPFAKLAYDGDIPVGMIQFRPVPDEKIITIDCIWVPQRNYWAKGVATKLLAGLLQDTNRTLPWFDNQRPLALVTRTFPGGAPDQCTARDFFTRKGFQQVGADPDFLYYPLVEGFVYRPLEKPAVNYLPQEDDKGKVLIVCGPNGCPGTYPLFLKRMECYIRELDSTVPIVWLDVASEPEKVKGRNLAVGDCVVNGHQLRSFVLDKENFQKEVRQALRAITGAAR